MVTIFVYTLDKTFSNLHSGLMNSNIIFLPNRTMEFFMLDHQFYETVKLVLEAKNCKVLLQTYSYGVRIPKEVALSFEIE